MLERYPDKTNWNRVRFSDEVHFERDSQDKLFIIRRSDERYYQDCIQHVDESDAKDVKHHHCWATENHAFKSNIHFYHVSSNFNEKMSQRVYIDQMLRSIDRNNVLLLPAYSRWENQLLYIRSTPISHKTHAPFTDPSRSPVYWSPRPPFTDSPRFTWASVFGHLRAWLSLCSGSVFSSPGLLDPSATSDQ